ncbi:MAG: prolipoprotein diacylglyceryl transferase [Patescibacteria group bacterium]|nr:prolipoprotein diacylglyceryl transferase [Patescibacteria group bacterium]
MIPYFEFHTINLGPLTIQVWGLLVSLGALTTLWLSRRWAKKMALSSDIILDIFAWGLVGGLAGARIFYVIFYEPAFFLAQPTEIFKVWHGGASSLGALLGAAVAIWAVARAKKIKLKDFLPYLDIMTLAMWPGWAIGRVGCFLIHDHPGRLSDFFLTVNFPAGARHDLGLYESLLALFIFVVCLIFYKKFLQHPGRLFVVSFLIYAVARFALDFLRATDLLGADIRYASLTPAQWGMAVLFLGLTFALLKSKIGKQKNTSGEVAYSP